MTQKPKVTAHTLKQLKSLPPESYKKIVAITAYDFLTAKLVDELVDIVLVGDSLGMVVQGKENTLSVTMDQMVYHTQNVSRAVKHAHVVADMPFMSYQASEDAAVLNAGRLIAEGGASSIKLEGGVRVAQLAERLVGAGIPVLGHIGLTPQSVNAFGGYKIQGKTPVARESILSDALALEDAGAYAIVIEGVPEDVAKEITARLKIPTIGIGAGKFCDGQVLVVSDLLGMNPDFNPKFVKKYADLATVIRTAVSEYASEVQGGSFPTEAHSFYVNS